MSKETGRPKVEWTSFIVGFLMGAAVALFVVALIRNSVR